MPGSCSKLWNFLSHIRRMPPKVEEKQKWNVSHEFPSTLEHINIWNFSVFTNWFLKLIDIYSTKQNKLWCCSFSDCCEKHMLEISWWNKKPINQMAGGSKKYFDGMTEVEENERKIDFAYKSRVEIASWVTLMLITRKLRNLSDELWE